MLYHTHWPRPLTCRYLCMCHAACFPSLTDSTVVLAYPAKSPPHQTLARLVCSVSVSSISGQPHLLNTTGAMAWATGRDRRGGGGEEREEMRGEERGGEGGDERERKYICIIILLFCLYCVYLVDLCPAETQMQLWCSRLSVWVIVPHPQSIHHLATGEREERERRERE